MYPPQHLSSLAGARRRVASIADGKTQPTQQRRETPDTEEGGFTLGNAAALASITRAPGAAAGCGACG